MTLLAVCGLLAAGAVGGVLAGLLGIGGGLVFVPALLWLVVATGAAPANAMHVAVGSSLAAIVLTSMASVRSHQQLGNIDWAIFRGLLPGLVIGAVAGAALAAVIPGHWLRVVFATFLIVVALRMFRGVEPSTDGPAPARGVLLAGGAGIATLATLLGIGGGTLSVPFLAWCRLRMIRAVGTAAASGLPLALVGAVGLAIFGSGRVESSPWMFGYLWWPAALLLGVTAMVAAPFGARLAHRTNPTQLRRGFAVMLVVIAATVTQA